MSAKVPLAPIVEEIANRMGFFDFEQEGPNAPLEITAAAVAGLRFFGEKLKLDDLADMVGRIGIAVALLLGPDRRHAGPRWCTGPRRRRSARVYGAPRRSRGGGWVSAGALGVHPRGSAGAGAEALPQLAAVAARALRNARAAAARWR